MKQSGIIYQYVDKPALPDAVIVHAHRGEPAEPDPIISRAFNVPETIPVSVRNEEIETGNSRNQLSIINNQSIKTRLSYTFRAMIGGGMLGLLVLFSPFIITEANLRMNPPEQKEEIVFPDIEIVDDVVDTPTFSKLVNDKYIKKLEPVNANYSLIIPKIGVNSLVTANVDPADKSEYTSALKQGAAHAKGTALPDEIGSKYIFAHSTDYLWNINQFNAIFYLLKDLEPGDQVHIVYHGKLYPYQVSEKKIVNADDVFYLKKNIHDNRLILQTCYPPGTTWKRMLVFAEPIESILGSGDNISYNVDKLVID